MRWGSLIIVILILSSCRDKGIIYNETESIPNESWDADQPAKFEFEIEDTTKFYDFFLVVRNSISYEWSNLYLFAEIESPGKLVNVDTVEVFLADKKGEWYGDVSGSLVTTEQQLINHKRFPVLGKYTLYFHQAMRLKILKGISDVGLKIKEVSNE